MGMMVELLKHEGTSHSSSDLLKIFVKMGASWSAQDFRQAGVTPSGPGAFFLFCFRKTWHQCWAVTSYCNLVTVIILLFAVTSSVTNKISVIILQLPSIKQLSYLVTFDASTPLI